MIVRVSLFNEVCNDNTKNVQSEFNRHYNPSAQLECCRKLVHQPNAPLEVCEAVSVAHTGVIAFEIPVPTPLKTRAQNIQSAFCEEHCKVAPTMAQTLAKPMVAIRP